MSLYDYIPAGYRVNSNRKLELIEDPSIIWPNTKESKEVNIKEVEDNFCNTEENNIEVITDENGVEEIIQPQILVANKIKKVIK